MERSMSFELRKTFLSFRFLGLILAAGLSLSACGTSDSGEDASDSSEEAIQAGISSLSGSISLGSEGSAALASAQTWNPLTTVVSLFSVYAADACGVPAIKNACSSGVRSATYESCSGRRANYSGSVTLTFSEDSCRMSQSGDYVVRTVQMERSGFFGRTIETTSDTSTDYRGQSIGGGTKIERTGLTAFEVSILGVHKTSTLANGEQGFDIHTRTTSPLVISGQLNGTRTVNSGVVEVSHNLAEFLATFTLSNLEYNAAECCYPISGSISVEYTGSRTGTRTIEFDGSCGSANIDNQGVAKVLALPGCD